MQPRGCIVLLRYADGVVNEGGSASVDAFDQDFLSRSASLFLKKKKDIALLDQMSRGQVARRVRFLGELIK